MYNTIISYKNEFLKLQLVYTIFISLNSIKENTMTCVIFIFLHKMLAYITILIK